MRICTLVVVMAATVWLTLSNVSLAAADISDQARITLQKLEEMNGGKLEVKWDGNTETPSLLVGTLSKPSNHSPQWIAGEFLNHTKKLYGLHNPGSSMKMMDVDRSSAGLIRVRYQHLLFGKPVWGDGLTVQMDTRGVINRVEGRIYPYLEKKLFNRSMHASLSKRKAVETAVAYMKGKGVATGEIPDAQLVYLPTRPGTPLVYVITLKNRELDHTVGRIFIHGLTGRIIESEK